MQLGTLKIYYVSIMYIYSRVKKSACRHMKVLENVTIPITFGVEMCAAIHYL